MTGYHRFMTNVTCGLTAKKPGLTPNPTFVIEYWTTLLYAMISILLFAVMNKNVTEEDRQTDRQVLG